jgi:hypothetical protein
MHLNIYIYIFLFICFFWLFVVIGTILVLLLLVFLSFFCFCRKYTNPPQTRQFALVYATVLPTAAELPWGLRLGAPRFFLKKIPKIKLKFYPLNFLFFFQFCPPPNIFFFQFIFAWFYVAHARTYVRYFFRHNLLIVYI